MLRTITQNLSLIVCLLSLGIFFFCATQEWTPGKNQFPNLKLIAGYMFLAGLIALLLGN